MVPTLCPNLFCRVSLSTLFSFLLLTLALVAASPTASALAGEWRVTPIRLTLERGARSTVVNVQNDSDAPMNFQIKAMEWSQDINGEDQYTETNELIYFPRQMVVPSKEERAIRVGIKGGTGAREKTYRLFIEEVSPPRQGAENEQTQIAVTIRFAVPLFISPAMETVAGEIVEAKLHGGTLDTTLMNNGNVHFRVKLVSLSGMDARGETIFTQESNGWYLLSGASRTHSTAIPEHICSQLAAIDIQVQTDRLSFSRKIDADPSLCVAQ